jgi:hypothetical protein
MKTSTLAPELLHKMDAYWRAALLRKATDEAKAERQRLAKKGATA